MRFWRRRGHSRAAVVPPAEVASGGESCVMEAFHATFQAALNDEFEALVRDLRAAAGVVALRYPRIAKPTPEEQSSTRALVGELVARWTFVLATYRAHVAAEDEVVLPALAARVNNVAHAYELEHEAEDELFETITAALDEVRDALKVSDKTGAEGDAARERLRAAIQRGARAAHATKTALAQHLAKEAAHLVPLLNGHFTPGEQTELVRRFIASIPAGWVGPVLARGPTTGERGPLRTLLASWLAQSRAGAEGSAAEPAGKRARTPATDDVSASPPAKRARPPSSGAHPADASSGEGSPGGSAAVPSSPIDHIFQFHAALRRELVRLEADVLALPPPEDVARRAKALRTLEGRFVFFWGVYRAHSHSEDELVFPALENKDELHNVSHSYTLDHEREGELFVEVDACLRDLRVAAGLDVDAGEETEEKRAELKLSDPDPQERRSEPRLDLNDHAVVADVERRLQAACAAVRVCLETHVAREEAELWPLFVKHFSASEQGRLVGLIIGRTGAEVLQSMLSWQRKALTEEERVAMLETMRDATRGNTRFESWLETWWHGEEEAAAANGGTDIEKRDRDDANLKTRDRDDVNPAAIEGLVEVQEYLKEQQKQTSASSASSAAKAAAAASAAAAAVTTRGTRRAGTTCSA